MHHDHIEAAMGIKIAGNDLQKAVAGTSLMVVHPDDEVEDLKEEVMKDLEAVMGSLARQAKGVFVQASTLGACTCKCGVSLFVDARVARLWLSCVSEAS